MRIVHRAAGGDRVVEIDIDDPTRTVGDLVTALTPETGSASTGSASTRSPFEPVIDGAPVTSDVPLSAVTICEGSVVDTTAEPATTTPPARTVVVIGGIRAGVAVGADGSLTIGRDDGCDLCVDDAAMSGPHLLLREGRLRDLGSRNGTAVEGHPLLGSVELAPGAVVRAGTSRLAVRAHCDDRPAAVVHGLGARGGTIPFNRPPRVVPMAEATPLGVPASAPAPPAGEPLSIAGIVLPIVAGAVVAVLFSPFMAVFAALGPVLTIGTWWERRRRSRRAHRRAVADVEAAMGALDGQIGIARDHEILRRRALHPDPAEVVRRAEQPSVRLWERRPDHLDAFSVAIGVADEPFSVPLHPSDGDVAAPEAVAMVAAAPPMPDVPVAVDLSPGRVVGLVGDRSATMAVARSLLLQMATHHGPADLSVLVAADHTIDWRWATWLPHTADHATGRRGVALLQTLEVSAAVGLMTGGDDRACLVLLDGDDPFQGRGTVGRSALARPSTAAVVLVSDEHRLPARCDLVVRADALGRLTLTDPRRAERGRPVLGWGVSAAVAEHGARRLARLDDPELPIAGAGVPAAAPLLRLLGISGDDIGEIERRWRQADGTAHLHTPIGSDGEGVVELDFVADGPHVLVGGTTGSGKSELLRSIVAGVAATADPDHVAMVLVDYKGGAAFDCCAELPHVAGLVTDLDAELAARALRCLEAELRHRERRLRAVGADDMASFRAATAGDAAAEPLPRLLVIVDEFASLAADLPDFLSSLVGVAQRGRSLGVHLVLATQRPAGVVTDDIRANTGCRVALRVTDRGDSIDVIGSPDASAIPRDRPGRAVVRFGPGDLVPFQAAFVTGHADQRAGVVVHTGPDRVVDDGTPTDLRRLVGTIVGAHEARGGRRTRSPWPAPLPDDLRRDDRRAAAPGQWFLVDCPDEQCRRDEGWTLDDGHLVVIGGPGAGTTTTLATAALAVTRGQGTDAPHVHVLDLDSGALTALADLPSTGTVVGPSDGVRRHRLVRWLDDEVGRRRGAGIGIDDPRILLVVDDLGGLARSHDPVREPAIHDRFHRIWADGPAVGITVAVSLRRAADLPPALTATAGTVLIQRGTDQSDALRFGVKSSADRFPPGRAVRATDGAVIQVVRDGATVARAADGRRNDPLPRLPPHEVGELRPEIRWSEATPLVVLDGSTARLRFAVRDRDLALADLVLHRGEHAVVLGPPRSGRTTALATLARAAGAACIVVGRALADRSGLDAASPTDIEARLAAIEGPALVLVDDAVDLDDPTGILGRLATTPPAGVHLVVTGRADRFRSAYGHWAADIKSSRAGLLLRPDPIDGDLLGQQFPARLAPMPVPGRGMLVSDGVVELVQTVLPDDQSAP
ncbi:MAG: FtsK/SpoIIIE domain-containing protein [Acidimicrobiales bacterium]